MSIRSVHFLIDEEIYNLTEMRFEKKIKDLTDYTINAVVTKFHSFNLPIFSIIDIAGIIGFSIDMKANGKFIG